VNRLGFWIFGACLIISSGNELAFPQIADRFVNPLEGGWATITQRFGLCCWYNRYKGYHLGYDIKVIYTPEDLNQKKYKQVFSPANGRVVRVDDFTPDGYSVVIEHELPLGDPDGEFVCSRFFHMLSPGPEADQGGIRLNVGQRVAIGEVIGFISPYKTDHGNSIPHQHYGIRKGSYKPGTDQRTGKYYYPGYTTIVKEGEKQDNPKDPVHTTIISEWLDPEDFLARHARPTPTTGFLGSTLSWQYYAYGAAYNSPPPGQTHGTFVVTGGIGGTFRDVVNTYFNIIVDNSSITFDYSLASRSSTWSESSLSLAPTIHNGIALNVISGPSISSVTIDPATNMLGFDQTRFSFTSSQLQVDWQSLPFTRSTIVKLNINSGDSVIALQSDIKHEFHTRIAFKQDFGTPVPVKSERLPPAAVLPLLFRRILIAYVLLGT